MRSPRMEASQRLADYLKCGLGVADASAAVNHELGPLALEHARAAVESARKTLADAEANLSKAEANVAAHGGAA